LHHRPYEDWHLSESISLAALEIKCGLFYSHTIRYVFFYPFFVFYWFLQVLNNPA
jgi:hypothetical protein